MAGRQRLISWLHPCSTSNVALNTCTCAHGPLMGHPNWAGCDIHPLNEPDVLVGPTHPSSANPYAMSCAPSQAHTRMHSSHTDPSKCPRTFPLSPRPYVQCRPICHVVCPISGPHAPLALCPHTDPYAQPRGSALIPFVTPRPPKLLRLALP
jgi:hypothetical protein